MSLKDNFSKIQLFQQNPIEASRKPSYTYIHPTQRDTSLYPLSGKPPLLLAHCLVCHFY